MTYMEKEFKKEWMYLYAQLTHFTAQQKHSIVNQWYSSKKKNLI